MGAGTAHGDARVMTTNTLHIENTVRDYATWKPVVDKFDRFRADNGVRSYRLSRSVDDGNRVFIDLDFDSVEGPGHPAVPAATGEPGASGGARDPGAAHPLTGAALARLP